MSFPFTPSKRPFEQHAAEPNVRGKWRKTAPSASQQPALKVPTGAVVFRILCPLSKTGSLIGKSGSIISRIRKDTGAKIRLEETVTGSGDRIVVIMGSEKDSVIMGLEKDVIVGLEKDAEVNNEHAKEGAADSDAADGDQDKKGSGENDEEKDHSSVLEVKSEKGTSSAQKALLLVFERIIEGETEGDGGDEANKDSTVCVRLLIPSSQVGCVIGKGGSVVKQMTSDSGAEIRVHPSDIIPAFASPHDEVVLISGTVDSARKALELVSQQLLEHPPREPFPTTKPPPSHVFAPTPRPEALPPMQFLPPQGPPFSNRHYDIADIPPFPKFLEGAGPGQIQGPREPLIYRLLCSNERVGSVIGRGGNIVKSLQHEIGCEIKILETTPASDDRLIVISSPLFPLDKISPAQDGVLQVQHRIAMAVPEDKEVMSRLLVSSNQIGCLLGKGGSIIAEMRKVSGAHIRILSKDQTPKGVPENDEVVQVSGELKIVQEALLHITTKLKNHLIRDRGPIMNHVAHPAIHDQLPPFGPYMGRREPSPPRSFPNLPPFQNDFITRHHDERPGFAHAMHGSGLPHSLERIPPRPWLPQNMAEGGGGGSMPLPDYPGGDPQRRMGGFAGGNHPAVVTNTTVDVVVPRALVPSIYGEDGGCLRQIREISEAKITITEPRPEATETVIIISGSPEQTHAAQSLIQAFVLVETGAT